MKNYQKSGSDSHWVSADDIRGIYKEVLQLKKKWFVYRGEHECRSKHLEIVQPSPPHQVRLQRSTQPECYSRGIALGEFSSVYFKYNFFLFWGE